MTYSNMATVYADESDDKQVFVLACLAVPTLQARNSPLQMNAMTDDWHDYFAKAKAWRRYLKSEFNIPVSKELKGSKLATGHNRYVGGNAPLFGHRAIAAYRSALQSLDFLAPGSVFSVAADRNYTIYGHRKLEAALYALFQRLQRQLSSYQSVATIFFDEGHAEYRGLYRKACVHLPTGSANGTWASGASSKSIPLSSTIEDANFKDSRQSVFIQIADLIAYATLLKIRSENGMLSDKQARLGMDKLHDAIPRGILNTRVVRGGDDGIVRLRKTAPFGAVT